jgi:hypothetical protein
LPPENLGTKNGGDFEQWSDTITDLHAEPLSRCTFQNRIASGIRKRANRLIMRCLGIRKLNALFVYRNYAIRSKIKKILSHQVQWLGSMSVPRQSKSSLMRLNGRPIETARAPIANFPNVVCIDQ